MSETASFTRGKLMEILGRLSALLVLLISNSALAQSYQISPIEDPQRRHITATAINNSGLIAGQIDIAYGSHAHAFIMVDGVPRDVHTLPEPPYKSSWQPRLNNSGRIAGIASDGFFLWSPYVGDVNGLSILPLGTMARVNIEDINDAGHLGISAGENGLCVGCARSDFPFPIHTLNNRDWVAGGENTLLVYNGEAVKNVTALVKPLSYIQRKVLNDGGFLAATVSKIQGQQLVLNRILLVDATQSRATELVMPAGLAGETSAHLADMNSRCEVIGDAWEHAENVVTIKNHTTLWSNGKARKLIELIQPGHGLTGLELTNATAMNDSGDIIVRGNVPGRYADASFLLKQVDSSYRPTCPPYKIQSSGPIGY